MAKNMKLKAQKIKERREKETSSRAVAKYVRISPYKVRVVLDLIRGKNAKEAVAILENTNKSAAEPVMKVVKSAMANAEHNKNMNADSLKVTAAYADQGPTNKRMMPRAQGRGFRILKRTSHITVVLDTIG